jgi:hypothetical protein
MVKKIETYNVVTLSLLPILDGKKVSFGFHIFIDLHETNLHEPHLFELIQ